jgi:hypothetical protein
MRRRFALSWKEDRVRAVIKRRKNSTNDYKLTKFEAQNFVNVLIYYLIQLISYQSIHLR